MPVITRTMATTGGCSIGVPLSQGGGNNPSPSRSVKKILSLWAQEGLDLTSSAFNKLYLSESKYKNKRDKYD